ncbi:MAG TPA: DUF2905 domain-containing protein [Saprospiraceae bacterium]|nr:DUF2905 domain-containing protein [Saprospiraceae bacterium]MCC6689192.1 DUF2905 domain-containing protein [Saprospiraceae bacterium]HMV23703.1 DUF2905 domain-containing protein [Saprospiraceae bacterium]HMW75217.1 DUF2905 domain-containing protein [Saprospiraceae bacterium]HMX81935.1 DUF2905 domain-containing protein [Saprospiraceae bacterium]
MQIAKGLIIAGVILIIIGLIYYFFQDKLGWLGRLPGDFSYKKDNFSFFAPITTMLILSILLSVIINLIRRFL